MLAATVLVHSYSSTVTSHLTLPKMKLAVNSFEDLTLDEDIGLIVREDHVLGQEILVGLLIFDWILYNKCEKANFSSL